MTREEKLKAIYDEMVNKNTTFWNLLMIGDVIQYLQDTYQWYPDGRWGIEFEPNLYSEEAFYVDVNSLCVFWGEKREGINTQSDECIDYVYSLINPLKW